MSVAEQELRGRVALVTGASRRIGIAYTLAKRLANRGADVVTHSWAPADAAQSWGADPLGPAGVVQYLRNELDDDAGQVTGLSSDLVDPSTPHHVIDSVVEEHGGIDILIATHARSSTNDLASSTADELDLCWAINVRSVLLLVQRYLEVRDHSRPGGRVVVFTSGQHYAPMSGEIPYATTKGALQQITKSLAQTLAPRKVTANCIDPGPVDTGYADDELREFVANSMAFKRWGTPDDVANLVEWLTSDAGGWMTGQTLAHDGGASLGWSR